MDDTGYCDVNETIICTFNCGDFFRNKGFDNIKMQIWLNDLQHSEISKMCFETYGHNNWGNLTNDQLAYLYAKTM